METDFSRLDTALVSRGLAKTRSLAARVIAEGAVSVNGKTAAKPAFRVKDEDVISVSGSAEMRYVSRGGLKLEAALDVFNISPDGARCLDIGASSGGFTDCLLSRGAREIVAVDSGEGQLDEKLRCDPRVICRENFNARFLTEKDFGKFDIVVMDVSFISQSLLFDAVRKVLLPGGVFISLIKPQFEAGRKHLSSAGIVKDPAVRQKVISDLREKAKEAGLRMISVTKSPIKGGDGNEETLALYKNEEDFLSLSERSGK